MPIKNIILDWSGTLVDDFPPVLEATNQIFLDYGRPAFSEAEFREKFFLPFADFYQIHLPEVSMADLDARYHETFQLLQESITVLPHAREFLDYCRARQLPTFLLSTIHSRHFAVQGERLGLTAYFKSAYTQAYDKRNTILHLLAEHNLNADETLFIGDMMHDIEAARHGGVRSCAVLTGYDSLEKLKRASPDLLFRDLGQVQRYLDRHLQERQQGPPLATVGALIYNALGQVLMVKTYKWSDLWGIPGGKIQRGETAEEGLIREIREETGLEVREIRYVTVQDCIDSKEFYKPAHFLLLNYTVVALSSEVTLNDEADTYRWVSLEEALEMPLNTPTRVLLERVRSQSGSNGDMIQIEGLELESRIGVPEEERATPQRLLASLWITVGSFLPAIQTEEIERTVNYYTVVQHVTALAQSKPRKLIETLAQEIALEVLGFTGVLQVRVRIEKFILPQTKCVAVEVVRDLTHLIPRVQ